MKKLRGQKKWVSDFEEAVTLIDEAEVLLEFYKEDEATAAQVDAAFTKALDATESLSSEI